METFEARPGGYRGVWYCCGQATLLPGKSYVYSGPMATYCAWHRPMAAFAPEAGQTFFVFGDADNAPALGRYDHRAGRFLAPVVLGRNPDGDAHRNPTLLIDGTGHLHVFYGAHGRATWVLSRRLTSGSRFSHNNEKVVFNHQRGTGDFRVFWSYGDSLFPPATREVAIYAYGEALDGPRRIEV